MTPEKHIHKLVREADRNTTGGVKMSMLSETGASSSMRAGMFLCIGTASYLAIAGLHLGTDLIQLTGLVVTFLGAGIGGKVVQKAREGR